MAMILISQGRDMTPWAEALKEKRPELDLRVYPDDSNKEEVAFALVWNHPLGVFKEFPNLKCISSMGAGVDHIMKDPELPANAAITRVTDENLTRDMADFCVALVMNHLRGLAFYKMQEAAHDWQPRHYLNISDVTIGVMGVGVLGAHVASQLSNLGFKVNGWARSKKMIEGVEIFSGDTMLGDFLATSDILICLLPLTKETTDILNRDTFQKLPKNAFVINVARGAHLVDADLIEMIDTGHLSGASLDVFRQEPLPEEHPFWSHPKINVTPHIASVTEPKAVVSLILENYDRVRNNEHLLNVVSPQKGY
ncbi:2-hydroxyacid dehydrogenase [Pontibacter sp. MBLB2868]|uniref:2-hydroxyacid dehydrogenase n=1 Tax=Pontibacter sp. MBLB2868 TaxID=3451555 RepID=UPI003F74D5B6